MNEPFHVSSKQNSTDAVLETALKKNIHAVIDTRPRTLEGRQPAQVVRADQEVVTRRDSVCEIKSAIARSSTVGHISVNGIIGRETRIERPVTRHCNVSLRPASSAANLPTVRDIDALACASSNVAHVAAPPSFATQREMTRERQREIDIQKLAMKFGASGNGLHGSQEAIEAGQPKARASVFSDRIRVTDPRLNVR